MKEWLNKLKMNISRFMYGRNGQDELGTAAYASGIVVYLISVFFKNGTLVTIGMLLFVYAIFRGFSKNIWKRQQENAVFLDLMKRPEKYVALLKLQWEYRHTHRYYMCWHCGQIIRVPKGKKKIEITCPKCRRKFIRRT